MCTDTGGAIHISWVWRENSDVATNHDLAYARSTDGGNTWQKSSGETYQLPITAATAEVAWHIPQQSGLINSTSMFADAAGRPYIATYWRPDGADVPQYHLVYHDGSDWQATQIGNRTRPFRLSGTGTRRIPMSRPQIVADVSGEATRAYMVFRDVERGDLVSLAVSDDISSEIWRFVDLSDFSVGMWEPTYDTELWKKSGILHLFVQWVAQGDDDAKADLPPQEVSVIEWRPSGN